VLIDQSLQGLNVEQIQRRAPQPLKGDEAGNRDDTRRSFSEGDPHAATPSLRDDRVSGEEAVEHQNIRSPFFHLVEPVDLDPAGPEAHRAWMRQKPERCHGLDALAGDLYREDEINVHGGPRTLVHHQRKAAAERIRNARGVKSLQQCFELNIQINHSGLSLPRLDCEG